MRRRRGLTLVETLMSLVICTMLLGAVAAAFTASSAAVEDNDQFYRCAQTGRVALNQILREIRVCEAIQVSSDHIDLVTSADANRTYRYDSAGQQALLVDDDAANTPSYTLGSNITSMTFTATLAPDPKTHVNRVTMVALTMTMTVGSNSVTVTGSAAPRVALVY